MHLESSEAAMGCPVRFCIQQFSELLSSHTSPQDSRSTPLFVAGIGNNVTFRPMSCHNLMDLREACDALQEQLKHSLRGCPP